MKNKYLQPHIWLCALVCLICAGYSTQAQNWSSANPVTVCPGEVGTYTLSGLVAGSRLTGSTAGTVLGGQLLNSPSIANGSITFQVRWEDFPFKGNINSNIEVPRRDGNGNITGYQLIGIPGFLTVLIRSVKNLSGPSAGVLVPYCSTAPFSIDLPVQTFTEVPTEQIPARIYEFPASWAVSGATLIPSFPSTPSNFRLYQGSRNITVTPQPGGNLSLRVFSYNSNCNQANSGTYPLYSLISSPGNIEIFRQPTASISTPSFSVFCGDLTPRTLTANASQGQGLTGFSWSLPSGWAFQGPSNTASVDVIPSGSGGGTISVSANYSCGPSISTSSATLQAGFRPELAPPVFVTANYDLCLNETKRFTVEPVPSATSYQWTVAPANLTPNGTITTTVPYLDVTAPGDDTMPQGEVTVRANASGGCLASAPTTKRFQIGIGTAEFTTSVGTYGYVCPDAPIPFHIERFNGRGNESYAWYVDGDYVSNSATYFEIKGPPVGQNTYVQLVITNNCGAGFQFGRRIYGAAAIDGVACDVMRQGPTKPTTTAAYPNPADGQLTVEQGGGAAVLRNAYGQPVWHQTAKPGRLRLDTSHLPAGFYFLETRDVQGNAKRQQIRIEH